MSPYITLLFCLTAGTISIFDFSILEPILMSSLKKLRSVKIKSLPLKFFLLLTLFSLVFSATTFSQENHPCKRASIQLRGDLDVIMNRGGLWALMEQTEGLQDKSVLGMQSDGKLARIVGQFETMCEGDKKPSKQLFNSITNILGAAALILTHVILLLL